MPITRRVALSLFRGWHGPTVTSLVVGCSVVMWALPTLFHLPHLFTTADVVAPMASLAALVVAVASFSAAQEPAEQILVTGPVLARALNPIRVCAVLAVGDLLLAIVGSADLSAASTTAALAGEGLAVASRSEIGYAWALPSLHLLAALTFGAAGRVDLAPWAWILSTRPTSGQMCVSVLILVVGLALWTKRRST